jgi:MFS family permease
VIAGVRQQFATVASFAPRAFWFVWWGTLVNRLGGFVVPLLTIYLVEVRHLSVAEAGGIVSVFGGGNIIASLIGGKLADRIGRRATMLVSLFGGSAAMFALAFARTPLAIAVMVGICGLVGELYRPAVLAFVADVVPPARRVDAFGILYWAINLGFAVASVIGGLLANIDFTILFIADGITMLVYGVLVAVAVPETKPPKTETTTAAPPSRSWFRDRELVILIVISSFFMLLPMQAGATLSAHMSAQGFTPAAYGLVMAVNGLAIILLQPSMIGWIQRFDAQRVIVAAALLYGVGIAMHGLGTHVAIHMAAVVVWTFGEIIDAPTRSAVVSNLAPPDARGRYQGALVMTFGIAQLFGPKVGTWVWQHEGANVLWSACLVLGIAVAIAFAITAPGRRGRAG